jgi:hypothetical protein
MNRKFFGKYELELAYDLGALGMSRPVLSQSPEQVVGYSDISLGFTLKNINRDHKNGL